MSEIAEELERLAEECKQRTAGFDADIDRIKSQENTPDDYEAMRRLDGKIEGLYLAARMLRDRAAELRAQRSGSILKPKRVEDRQWWRFGGGVPRRVTGFEKSGGHLYACFNGRDSASHPRDEVGDMLKSSDWLYLGDGLEPAY